MGSSNSLPSIFALGMDHPPDPPLSPSHSSRRYLTNGQDSLDAGINLPNMSLPLPHEYTSSAPEAAQLGEISAEKRFDPANKSQSNISSLNSLILPGGEDGESSGMERSVSDTSIRSNQSLKLSAKEVLQRRTRGTELREGTYRITGDKKNRWRANR